MSDLAKQAIAVLVISAGAIVWGISYRADHPYAQIGAFFGASDSTYTLAGWAMGLGFLAFLIGVGMLVAGLNRPSSGPGAGPSGLEM